MPSSLLTTSTPEGKAGRPPDRPRWSLQRTLRDRSGRVALTVLALGLLATIQLACGRAQAGAGGKRLIVLGIDGMDYALTRRMMEEGRLPNLTRLAQQGSFAPLGTSVPPQSPVAWSNFITGLDSGGHGIYDFVHRDPQTLLPYLSTSRTEEGGKPLTLGKWKLPLSPGKVELLRHGTPFWEALEERGVETTIFRMPANFPPSGSATRELSGMGTPDLPGTPGTFSFYTSELFAFYGQDVSGGEVYEVWPEDGVVHATLYGPENPFLVESERASLDFQVYLDPQEPLAKLVVGDEVRLLQVGEWSDWVPVEFDLIPTQSAQGIVRFYLKQVHPEFELYATPVNHDPMEPVMPISTPPDFAAELAAATGRFYTQGMPEDTKSLTEGVLTRDEFLQQARLAGEEIISEWEWVLGQFESGLLFYYFGNLDQVSHVLWRSLDPTHPAYDPELDAPYAEVIPSLYERMDQVVGYTLDHMGEGTTLIVMSDHGFTSWKRTFNLNSWLRENGYLAVKDPNLADDPGMFLNVDWNRTLAYGLGINALYLNLQDRERNGIVAPGDREGLMEEIASKLLAEVDPATGQQAVTKVYRREEVYRDRGYLDIGPDLVVGYAKGTRCSYESALGEMTPEVFADNTDEWSGDHLMDHEAVPGILVTSRPLQRPAPALQDLAAAILAEFGIDGFPVREGTQTARR